MLDNKKIANFIADRRKAAGMTQAEIAKKLNVTFQAVSKWENGTLPNVELLTELARILHVTVDEILAGQKREEESFTYSKAGVDISYTDAIKQEMSLYLQQESGRVLNRMGAFASLYDIAFPEIEQPVLVLKSEEPGSKQKLAMEYGYSESICHDLINHLVNDIAVMGAKPLAVLDTIVCGRAEKETIKSLVKGISDACAANDCALVGGETSIQPQVIDSGVYVLTASIAGILSRTDIIDGSQIREGDVVLAVASNGLHTNGYTLVRMLLDKRPEIKQDKIDGQTFLTQIMKPHTPYSKAIQQVLRTGSVRGMAHITGGGISGNLCRIIPEGLSAEVDLSQIRLLPIFRYIQEVGNITEREMLATFNCGVGLVVVADRSGAEVVASRMSEFYDCYPIGRIVNGEKRVELINHMR